MFIKLLATNIVASNFFGRSKSLVIIENAVGFSSNPLLKSERVNEKKATSAPEIRPEQINNTINRTMPDINEISTARNESNKLVGSGSKIKKFGYT